MVQRANRDLKQARAAALQRIETRVGVARMSEEHIRRIEGAALARQRFRYADFIMAAFVAILLLSNLIGASKPSPLFFDAAFREVNEGREVPVIPAEAAIIGDSLTSDMAGGRGYGMKTVYYRRPGAAPANDSVDVTVEELRAIPALL